MDINHYESLIPRGGEIILDREDLHVFLEIVKCVKRLGYRVLIDLTCVDFPDRDCRFEMVYMFLDIEKRRRLKVKLPLTEIGSVPSIVESFRSAGWLEREVFDMYGVNFSDSGDLRRILTDYGFEGYPMRKDFPLSGYKEVRYDIEMGKVVQEDVKLDQEYRDFDFLTPWEGTQYKDQEGESEDS